MSSKRTPFAALSGFLAVALLAVIALAVVGVFDRDDSGSKGASGANGSLASPSAPLPADASVADIYAQVSKGVVQVESRANAAGPLGGVEEGTGSGFFIDERGRVVTNQHVVEGANQVRVRLGAGQEPIPAKVLGSDPSTDIALLKVDPGDVKGGVKPLALGNSGKLRVGEPTIAIGSPFGLEGSLTTGVVSALKRQVESPNGFAIDDVVQTDAAINPGNSGGPLLDARGRVIGINAQIASSGARANSGVGFAIPINTAKQVVPALERDGKIKRPYLGVSTADVTEDIARRFDLPVKDGAIVTSTVDGGPAERAGIRPAGPTGRDGDILLAVNGEAIKNPGDVADRIEELKPGDETRVEVLRDDKRKTVTVTLGERPDRPASP
ncbi:trypsin-like peptidase domain-containing protein [soil metagenome]